MHKHTLKIGTSQKVLANLLEMPGWSVARVARTLGISRDYIRGVQSGKHGMRSSEVETLAKASGRESHEMIFESIKRTDFAPKDRALYDMALAMIGQHREFSEIMTKKPAVRSLKRSTATAAKTSTKPAARRAFARS